MQSNISKDFLDGEIKAEREADLFDLTPQPPLLKGEGEEACRKQAEKNTNKVCPNPIGEGEDKSASLCVQPCETKAPRLLGEGLGVRSVLTAARDLYRYYHTMTDANPNASLYDIKEYFQGRNDKGKMNATSNDPVYTSLLNELKTALRALGEEIKPKVYEYGFLK